MFGDGVSAQAADLGLDSLQIVFLKIFFISRSHRSRSFIPSWSVVVNRSRVTMCRSPRSLFLVLFLLVAFGSCDSYKIPAPLFAVHTVGLEVSIDGEWTDELIASL